MNRGRFRFGERGRAVPRAAGSLRFALVTAAALAAAAMLHSHDSGAQEASGGASSHAQVAGEFEVNEYRVLGNTTLDTRAVEAAVYPHLGPNKSFQDVEAARAALESAYHERGFGTVYVDVPEQTVDDGVIRLRVTEGRINSTRISGAKYFSERQIRAALPAATPGQVPDLPALQRQIGAFNAASQDRAVVPVLKAGPQPGTVDVALKVQDHLPFHGSIELNNQYTADTKPLRLIGYLSYDNLFGRLNSLSLQYQVTPQEPKDTGVFAAGYVSPAGPGKLSFTYIHSSSDVATVGGLAVIGNGTIVGAHYDLPIVVTTATIQSINFGADYKDFGQNVATTPSAVVQTPISYLNVSAVYAGLATTAPRTYTWSAGASFSIRGIGSTAQEFADKCFGCRQNYFLVRVDGSVDQRLRSGFEALARVAGQYSATPVISNEQFLLGGAQTVRGYYEAEELGDRGFRGTLELRAPTLFGTSPSFRAIPFLFSDAGQIDQVMPLPEQPPHVFLSSFGAGLDMQGTRYVSGNLTWARVLHSGSRTEAGDSRVLFVVRGSW
jgi:hemolysin activation/secretion protein